MSELLKIACISNTYNNYEKLHDLQEIDIFIHSGNATTSGSVEETISFIEWFGNLGNPDSYKIFMPGKRDYSAGFLKDFQNFCDTKGVILLIDRLVEIEIREKTYKIYGFPWSLRECKYCIYQVSHRMLINKMKKIPKKVDILISHCLCYGILDKNTFNINVGSEELLELVKEIKPLVHISGNLQGIRGVETVNETIFVNPSRYDKEIIKTWKIIYLEII